MEKRAWRGGRALVGGEGLLGKGQASVVCLLWAGLQQLP